MTKYSDKASARLAFRVTAVPGAISTVGLAALMLLLASCQPLRPSLPGAEPASATSAAPAPVNIDVYLDASSPIRGFLPGVESDQKNYFVELLDKAHGILASAWPADTVTIRFWRFGGSDPQRIPGIRDFLLRPAQFTEQTTRIEKAIEASVPGKSGADELKIIITDLFQNDNDVDNLATQLNDKYLRHGDTAVAVLGIRNPFSGPIDDLPGALPAGAADSLPFYILIGGKLSQVQRAADRLEQRLGLPPDKHFKVVFTSQPLAERTQPLQIPEDKKASFTTYQTMVQGASERHIPQIGIRKDGNVVNVPLASFPGPEVEKAVGPILHLKKRATASVQVWNSHHKTGPGEPAANDPFSADVEAKTLAVNTNRLESHAIYLVQIDLAAEPGDLSQFSTWYLELADVRRILAQKQFDLKDQTRPGKTPNLRHFLQTMTDKAFQKDVPIARYYIYIKIT